MLPGSGHVIWTPWWKRREPADWGRQAAAVGDEAMRLQRHLAELASARAEFEHRAQLAALRRTPSSDETERQ